MSCLWSDLIVVGSVAISKREFDPGAKFLSVTSDTDFSAGVPTKAECVRVMKPLGNRLAGRSEVVTLEPPQTDL